MVVVKANGYGHGALNVVNLLSYDKDIIFCTFSIEEAIEIRKNGIKNRIFIFSKLQEKWIILARKHNIWINASNLDDLKILTRFLKKIINALKSI